MKIYGADNKELIVITAIERQGSELVLRGKIFGALPMTAKLRPEELRGAFRLLSFRTLLFGVSMLFRRTKR
jgi:hypothetical protein